MTHLVEEATNVRVQNPVHLLALDAHIQRIERLMRAAPGPEPIGARVESALTESSKVDLANLIENRHHGLLNYLVLQSRDAEWALPPVCLRYVDPT